MNYLVLVNKNNKIPSNWSNQIQLIDIKNLDGEIIKIEKETLEKYNELKKAATKIGIEIGINDAYRSIKEQEKTYKQ